MPWSPLVRSLSPAPLRRVPFNSLPQLRGCTDDNLGKVTAFFASQEEKQSYQDFYYASAALVIFIEIAGLYVVTQTLHQPLGWKQGGLVLIFGIRSFDMFSDWAFFAISLRKGGAFALAYAADGGDPDQVWIAALAFCILGSLLYLPDLWGFYKRVDPDAGAGDAKTSAMITATVFFLEDLPQLVLNAGIYLPTLGIGEADPVAIFALVMSGLSLVLNVGLFVNESGLREWVMRKPVAPTIPADQARPAANFGFGEDTSI